MCGIAGVIGKSTRECLERVKNALRHRGPNDSGIFENSVHCVGLIHARLAILDLSPAGHQPMVSDDGKVVLVFNGEIYNYRELREMLGASSKKNSERRVEHEEKKEIQWQGNSDTEVLLQLYLYNKKANQPFGKMLKRLNGIFSFAIWDNVTQELFLARDALGVKPLYFANQHDRFVFGSEIKAMLPLMDKFTQLDPAALQRYLTYLWCPGEGTPDLRIRKVNPGEFLLIQNGKIVERRAWYQNLVS